MAKGTTYNVVRVVTQGEGEGTKKFYRPVGKVIIHEGGKSGVLFINILDSELALFRQDPKAKDSDDAGPAEQ